MSEQRAEEREAEYAEDDNQETESTGQYNGAQNKQGHQQQAHPHQHLNPHQARYQQHMQDRAQAQGTEERKESNLTRFKSFVKECVRVLRITKKPTGIEFKTIVKVSGLGMLLIGLLGFIIQLIRQVLVRF